MQPKYDALTHMQEIQLYWHFNNTGGNYQWKPGRVCVFRNGQKSFVPNDGLGRCIILPHRMEEVRILNQ